MFAAAEGAAAGAGDQTGYFIDAAVSGVTYTRYDAAGKVVGSGTTEADGSFTFAAGENIVFTLGGVTIGDITADEMPADGKATIQDVVGVDRSITDDATVLKIAQFLQTLDADGNPNNGIQVEAETVAAIKTSGTITADTDIEAAFDTAVLADLGLEIVTADDAKAHIDAVLQQIKDEVAAADTALQNSLETATGDINFALGVLDGVLIDDVEAAGTLTSDNIRTLETAIATLEATRDEIVYVPETASSTAKGLEIAYETALAKIDAALEAAEANVAAAKAEKASDEAIAPLELAVEADTAIIDNAFDGTTKVSVEADSIVLSKVGSITSLTDIKDANLAVENAAAAKTALTESIATLEASVAALTEANLTANETTASDALEAAQEALTAAKEQLAKPTTDLTYDIAQATEALLTNSTIEGIEADITIAKAALATAVENAEAIDITDFITALEIKDDFDSQAVASE